MYRPANSLLVQAGQASLSATASAAAAAAPGLHPIVIRFGRLGDMVLLSPLLNLLRRRYRMPCWLIGSGGGPPYATFARPDLVACALGAAPQRQVAGLCLRNRSIPTLEKDQSPIGPRRCRAGALPIPARGCGRRQRASRRRPAALR